jgi:hypothetical protein
MNSLRALTIGLAILFLLCGARRARAGDYLNDAEIERVREAQAIDQRTKVFLHIAERRLNVLLGVSAPAADSDNSGKKDKKDKKDKENKENPGDYGPEPSGSTVELLQNYTSVMSELFDKLDDANEKNKGNPNLTKAMEKLGDACQAHLQKLNQLRAKIKSPAEQTALEKAMEIAKMAIDGARGFKSQQ